MSPPHISLLKDQVHAVEQRGKRAVYIGDCSEEQKEVEVCCWNYQLRSTYESRGTGRAGKMERQLKLCVCILYAVSHSSNQFVNSSMRKYLKNTDTCR